MMILVAAQNKSKLYLLQILLVLERWSTYCILSCTLSRQIALTGYLFCYILLLTEI